MRIDPFHRREFLLRLGRGTLAAFALASGTGGATACVRSREPLRDALDDLFEDPDRAAAVGAAYLRQTPKEVSTDALLAQLFGSGLAAARTQAASDPTAFADRLRSQHVEDLDAGRIAIVDGWVLSLTEARVYALTALDRA